MTETRPTYNHIPADQERAHRALLRAALHAQAHAAARWLEPLLSYARALDALAQRDDASDNVLTAAFQEAHAQAHAAAALAAGLPLEAA